MVALAYTSVLLSPSEDHSGGPATRLRDLPELAGLDDSTLAARIRAGDVDAFSALYRAYYPRLVAVARVYVARAIAEELVQDFLAQLWERHAEWHVTSGIGVYLYTAIRNRARNQVRHDRVVERVEQSGVAANISFALGSIEESAQTRLEREDVRTAVDAALATLPKGMRTAFELRWMHGLSYAEIAQIMEIAEPAARKQVSKARAVIFPLLERFARELGI